MSKKLVLKASAIFFISEIIMKVGNLFFIPILTSILSVKEYGSLSLLLPLISFISVILAVGLYNPQMVDYNKIKDNKKYRSYIFTLNIAIIILILFLIGLFNIPLVKRFVISVIRKGSIDYPMIKLSFFIGVIGTFNIMSKTYSQMEKKFKKIAVLNVLSFFSMISSTLILIYGFNLGIYARLIGSLISNIVQFIAFYIPYVKVFEYSFNKNYLKKALTVGFSVLIVEIITYAMQYSDRIVLNYYIGIDEVAYYSVAYSLGMTINMVIISYINSIKPILFEELELNKTYYRDEYLVLFMYILSTFAILVMLFSNEIINILFRYEYMQAKKYIGFILIGILTQGIYIYLVNYLFFNEDTSKLPIFNLIAVIINIVLNVLFIPRYGAIIASISTFISFLTLLILGYIQTQKYNVIFQWKKIIMLYGVMLFPLFCTLIDISFIIRILYFIIVMIIFYYKNTTNIRFIFKLLKR